MKTTFWGLFVLVYFISQLHRNEALSSTAFYIIGHMANDITQVEKHLAEGANALELDVEFSQGSRPVQTRHGFPCCFRDCFSSEIFSYMLKYLRDLSTPEHPNYVQQLALIKMNLKVRLLSTEMLHVAGERLAEALMVYLFDGGYSGSNAWVLLSVPSPEQVILFRGVRDAFRRYQMAGLLDKIGYTVGDNSDLITIERSLDHLGIIDHIWIGDGSSSCLGAIRSRGRIERLVDERDTGEANFDRVFHWTVDEPISMRSSLRTGVDAIITNRADRLLQILSEDEFFGRFRLATADDRPWDKVIPDDMFDSLDLMPSPVNADFPASSAIVLADTESSAGFKDEISFLEEETNKESTKDCKSPSEGSLDTLGDFSVLGKDAETEKPDSTTAKPEEDDDDTLALLKELGNSSEDKKLSKSSRSVDDFPIAKSLFPNFDVQDLIGRLKEDKEVKLTSDLVELIWKLSAKPETPSISSSALHAILSLQTTTPSPAIPINLVHALLERRSDTSSDILRLLSPPTPNVSPELLRTLLTLYTPTTPRPQIPIDVVKTLLGIQQPTTSNVNLELLNLLIGSNSGASSILRPIETSDTVSSDLINILIKAMSEKNSKNTKDEHTEEILTTTESSVIERTTKSKKKSELTAKDNDNDTKEKDLSDSVLSDDLLDIETSTRAPKGIVKNATRNLPDIDDPPLPPVPGTTVQATFGPHGIHWKVIGNPSPGSPLRQAHPFQFDGNQFSNKPHFPIDRPPFFHHRPPHRPPMLSHSFISNNRPLFQSHLPSKITIHKPINLPLRYPIQSVGQPIKLPNKINIHVPVPMSSPRPYRYRIPYASTTPCPEPSEFYKYKQNYQPEPSFPEPQLLFPAVRPPTLPGNQHSSFLNVHKPEFPSSRPPIPQRPNFPNPSFPSFEEPPIFFDDIDSFDDFLKKNNNSHNVPKDFFASAVNGVKETNLSSEFSVTNENGNIENTNSQLSIDNVEEFTEVKTADTATTKKPVENESIDDLVDSLNLETITAKSVSSADPIEELLAAFEKINNDKEAVNEFLRRVNLSSALITEAPKLRIENNEFRSSTMLPEKSSLTQIFNLPPTAGLGWNGESISQAKLEQILFAQKKEKQPLDVVVIENSPLVIVPPKTANWPNRNNIQKRETTTPPNLDYDDFPSFTTSISRRPDIVINRPIPFKKEQSRPVTISKPLEGLRTGEREELMPGEVEISIPGELFIQQSNGNSENNVLTKFVKEITSINKNSSTESNDTTGLDIAEEEIVKRMMTNNKKDEIIHRLNPSNISRDQLNSNISPVTIQRKYNGVSLRHPTIPYSLVNSINPTTPYPKRVMQRIRTSKRPNVHINYRGSGETVENSSTPFPLLYHTMKSQVRKMQERSEQKYSHMNHQTVITAHNRNLETLNQMSNNSTRIKQLKIS